MFRRLAISATAVLVLVVGWAPVAHADTQPKPAWLTPTTQFHKIDITVSPLPAGAPAPKTCVPFQNGCPYDRTISGDSYNHQISSCEYIRTWFSDFFNVDANFYIFWTTIDLELVGHSEGHNYGDVPCINQIGTTNILDDSFDFHGISISVGAGAEGGDIGASGNVKNGDYKVFGANNSYLTDDYQTSAHGVDMYEMEHTTTWTTTLNAVNQYNTQAYASAWL